MVLAPGRAPGSPPGSRRLTGRIPGAESAAPVQLPRPRPVSASPEDLGATEGRALTTLGEQVMGVGEIINRNADIERERQQRITDANFITEQSADFARTVRTEFDRRNREDDVARPGFVKDLDDFTAEERKRRVAAVPPGISKAAAADLDRRLIGHGTQMFNLASTEHAKAVDRKASLTIQSSVNELAANVRANPDNLPDAMVALDNMFLDFGSSFGDVEARKQLLKGARRDLVFSHIRGLMDQGDFESAREALTPKSMIAAEFKLTALDAAEETEFREWMAGLPWFGQMRSRIDAKRQADNEPPVDVKTLLDELLVAGEGRYDYRGAWKAGITPTRISGQNAAREPEFHWPSMDGKGKWLKSPDHPTAWKEHFVQQFGDKTLDRMVLAGASEASLRAMLREENAKVFERDLSHSERNTLLNEVESAEKRQGAKVLSEATRMVGQIEAVQKTHVADTTLRSQAEILLTMVPKEDRRVLQARLEFSDKMVQFQRGLLDKSPKQLQDMIRDRLAVEAEAGGATPEEIGRLEIAEKVMAKKTHTLTKSAKSMLADVKDRLGKNQRVPDDELSALVTTISNLSDEDLNRDLDDMIRKGAFSAEIKRMSLPEATRTVNALHGVFEEGGVTREEGLVLEVMDSTLKEVERGLKEDAKSFAVRAGTWGARPIDARDPESVRDNILAAQEASKRYGVTVLPFSEPELDGIQREYERGNTEQKIAILGSLNNLQAFGMSRNDRDVMVAKIGGKNPALAVAIDQVQRDHGNTENARRILLGQERIANNKDEAPKIADIETSTHFEQMSDILAADASGQFKRGAMTAINALYAQLMFERRRDPVSFDKGVWGDAFETVLGEISSPTGGGRSTLPPAGMSANDFGKFIDAVTDRDLHPTLEIDRDAGAILRPGVLPADRPLSGDGPFRMNLIEGAGSLTPITADEMRDGNLVYAGRDGQYYLSFAVDKPGLFTGSQERFAVKADGTLYILDVRELMDRRDFSRPFGRTVRAPLPPPEVRR